jgi:hypothetical protein
MKGTVFKGKAPLEKSSAFHLLSRWFLAQLLESEDGGDMFLRNVG